MQALKSITLEGWLTLAAIILGPIIALGLQRASERRREKRQRKLWVFKELMATRGVRNRVSTRHVEALNAIEIEFSGWRNKERKVFGAWKIYLDHLNSLPANSHEQPVIMLWTDKGNDLFISLLTQMAAALGFKFDTVWLKNSTYFPKAHVELEVDLDSIRKLVLELMSGQRTLSTTIMTGETPLKMEVIEPRKSGREAEALKQQP